MKVSGITFPAAPFFDKNFPNLWIDVGKERFKTHRQCLIQASKFFAAMLAPGFKEATQYEIRLEETDPVPFGNLLKIIEGSDITFETVDELLETLLLVQRFEVTKIDILAELRKLRIPVDSFYNYLDYLNLLYPTGFSDALVDIIASQIRANLDITLIDEPLKSRLEASKNFRHYGEGFTRDLVRKIEEVADESEYEPQKHYILRSYDYDLKDIPLERVFVARSIAEVLLKARDWIWYLTSNLSQIPKSKRTPVISTHNLLPIWYPQGVQICPVSIASGSSNIISGSIASGLIGTTGDTGLAKPKHGPLDILAFYSKTMQAIGVEKIFEGANELIPGKLLGMLGDLQIQEVELE